MQSVWVPAAAWLVMGLILGYLRAIYPVFAKLPAAVDGFWDVV